MSHPSMSTMVCMSPPSRLQSKENCGVVMIQKVKKICVVVVVIHESNTPFQQTKKRVGGCWCVREALSHHDVEQRSKKQEAEKQNPDRLQAQSIMGIFAAYRPCCVLCLVCMCRAFPFLRVGHVSAWRGVPLYGERFSMCVGCGGCGGGSGDCTC